MTTSTRRFVPVRAGKNLGEPFGHVPHYVRFECRDEAGRRHTLIVFDSDDYAAVEQLAANLNRTLGMPQPVGPLSESARAALDTYLARRKDGE